MTLAVATLIVNAFVALASAIPSLIMAIKAMKEPEEDKQKLLDRIKTAQDTLPEWT